MKKYLYWLIPTISLILFIIWTILVKTVDVRYINDIGFLGFYSFNTQVNEWVKTLNNSMFDIFSTVLLGAGILTVFVYAVIGLVQLIKRKSLKKVDPILYVLLGVYVLSAIFYIVFELYKVTYSPFSVKGDLKASYPSSHLFISITYMVTAVLAMFKMINLKKGIKIIFIILSALFACCSILTRLMSGNHYFTDIIGGIFLSITLVTAFMAGCKCLEDKGIKLVNERL